MEKYKKGAKMKEKFNQENFRKLLRKGIGERTQKEFAKQTHVALITINHMLNKPQIPHPKQKTLKAFAENMENVSLEELMVACGYAELSIEDMVRNLEASINDFFLKQNRMFFENEEEISASFHVGGLVNERRDHRDASSRLCFSVSSALPQ